MHVRFAVRARCPSATCTYLILLSSPEQYHTTCICVCVHVVEAYVICSSGHMCGVCAQVLILTRKIEHRRVHSCLQAVMYLAELNNMPFFEMRQHECHRKNLRHHIINERIKQRHTQCRATNSNKFGHTNFHPAFHKWKVYTSKSHRPEDNPCLNTYPPYTQYTHTHARKSTQRVQSNFSVILASERNS